MKELKLSIETRMLLTFILAGFFFYMIRGMLAPFLVGGFVAYAFSPIALTLQKRGVPRALTSFCLLLGMLFFLTLGIMTIAPFVRAEIFLFINALPQIARRFNELMLPWLGRVGEIFPLDNLNNVASWMGSFSDDLLRWGIGFMSNLLSGGMLLANLLSFIIITPVVGFYLLKDWEKLVTTTHLLFPVSWRKDAEIILKRLDVAFAGFARGQALVCLTMAAFYSIALSIIKMPFALIIGILTGILTCLPYVGFLIGILMATLILLENPQFALFVKVYSVFGIGVVLEGYVLTPHLVSNRIGIHPVWMIFAVLAGGHLMGFLGILIALPLASAIGVILRFMLEKKKLIEGRS